jgi:cytochrome c
LVLVWDLASRTIVRRLSGHQGKVAALAVTADGRLAASAGWDGTVRLWDLDRNRDVASLRHRGAVTAVAFAADGSIVYGGGKDGTVLFWDTATGRPLGELAGPDLGVGHLAVVAKGTRLIAGGMDGSIRVWDTASLAEVMTFTTIEEPIIAFAVSADGTAALVGGRDGALSRWSLENGRPAGSFPAHPGPVWAVALTWDQRTALSAGSDGTVRIWDAGTAARIGHSPALPAEPRPWLGSDHPGARIYRACANCHALDASGQERSGPHFEGLFGRRAGSVKGYPYSSALDGALFVWNETTLSALFEEGPDHFLPGTRMPLQRIPRAEDRAALVAYLRTLTQGEQP